MGLENDADLKRLREELQKERERVERLEKDVRKEVFYLESTFYLEITGEGEDEARGTKPRGEAARSVTSKTSKTSNAGTKTKTSKASNYSLQG